MTKWERIQADRTTRHKERADSAWSHVRAHLEKSGITHQLFGSYARGDLKAHSDIDLMILDHLTSEAMSNVERIVTEASQAYGVKFDLLFAQYMSPSNVDLLLK